MLKRLLILAAGCVLAASPAAAQSSQDNDPSARAPGTIRTETVIPGRVADRNPRNQRNQPNNRRPQAAATPAQILAGATELAATLEPGCQVTEAILLGQSARGQKMYEAACATGPGFILISAAEAVTDPAADAIAAKAADCVDLFGQADRARETDPAANVGLQCTIPANQDVLKVVSAYATAAGVPCAVDQGSATGVRNGRTVYEVGCPGTDGFWVERQEAGWKATPCIEIKSMSGACRYTTDAEQAATLKAWLVGSDAAACDVSEARFMGSNANGSFFEAKCSAGDGYIARFNAEKVVQQIYPCAEAQRIGGGCTLTVVAAPAAQTPPTTEE